MFRLQAVFDSEDTSSDATTPQFTVSNLLWNFPKRRKNHWWKFWCKCKNYNNNNSYILCSYWWVGATDFSASETITGASSGATATVGTLPLVVKLLPVILY